MSEKVESGTGSRRRARLALLLLASVIALAVARKAVEIAGDARSDLLAVQPLDAAAPDLELRERDGRPVRVADLRGTWVLLNFWATWCEPCRDEMPSLASLARSLRGEKLTVVAASVDEGWAPVEGFLDGRYPELRVLLDPEAKGAHAYGTEKFPETYLLDPDGRLRAKFVGPRDWAQPAFRDYFEQAMSRTGAKP